MYTILEDDVMPLIQWFNASDYYDVTLGDINNDGNLDIVAGKVNDGLTGNYKGIDLGYINNDNNLDIAVGEDDGGVALGDVNNNNSLDIVAGKEDGCVPIWFVNVFPVAEIDYPSGIYSKNISRVRFLLYLSSVQ